MSSNPSLVSEEPSSQGNSFILSPSLRKDHRITIKIVEAKFPSLQNTEIDAYASIRILDSCPSSAAISNVSNLSSSQFSSALSQIPSPVPASPANDRGSRSNSHNSLNSSRSKLSMDPAQNEKQNSPTMKRKDRPSSPRKSVLTLNTSSYFINDGKKSDSTVCTYKTHVLSRVKKFCFWDQEFKISLPSELTNIWIEISVWCKRLLHTSLLGQVIFDSSTLVIDKPVESWFSLSVPKEKQTGSIRIRYHYTNESILPLPFYKPLVVLLIDPNIHVVTCLERVLDEKNTMAQVFVPVMNALDLHVTYLSGLGRSEIISTPDPTLLFRANSLATKSIEYYLKTYCSAYLHHTLKPTIKLILSESKSCEIDPHKVKSEETQVHLQTLIGYLEKCTDRIFNTLDSFPSSLRSIFSILQKEADEKWIGTDFGYIAVSSFLFLRFFNAAILGPKLFGLCEQFPNPTCIRTFTLMSKTLQQLANVSHFDGVKEPFMQSLNPFLTKTFSAYRTYIDMLTGVVPLEPSMESWDNFSGLNAIKSNISKHFFHRTKDAKTESVTQEHPLDIELQLAEVLRLLSRHIDTMESQAIPQELPTILNLKNILNQLWATQKEREKQTVFTATTNSVMAGTGFKPLFAENEEELLPKLKSFEDITNTLLTHQFSDMVLPD